MKRRRESRVLPPGLRRMLLLVFALFALLAINAAYLSAVTFAEWLSGETFQGRFYQVMFLLHLVLGLVLIPPLLVYGIRHMRLALHLPNRNAVRAGLALFVVAVLLLASGLALTRGLPYIEVRNPGAREGLYWLHAVAPLLVAWLFVLHRLAGRRINWRVGAWVGAGAVVSALLLTLWQSRDPREWNRSGPDSGVAYFQPSLARTASGDFIPAESLMNDQYCAECHEDAHEAWSASVHRFASFNNPVYRFSVHNTREFLLQRDGNVHAARFCAGCHDPVPFFSGAFDDPEFDDATHPTAAAGITCTACHAITHVASPRGNADYTIEEPIHYPFANSENAVLRWINQTLIKAKPAFHKKTFLKPLHRSTEFCSACHKVHIPEELNAYRWLRGQNHYDSFLLSGVSGHSVSSFYYPDRAEENCNGCHMPLQVSGDFGAQVDAADGQLKIHDHFFPGANTAMAWFKDLPDWAMQKQREILEGSVRLDLFGIREGGRIDGGLAAPLDARLPPLVAGREYLLEVVLRTLTLGHLFTEGTADSNEVWVAVDVYDGDRLLGTSGGRDPVSGAVDRDAHFVNTYALDREGRRIDRRNVEDIFTSLYNHQIPPGAADTLHFRLSLPADARGPVRIEAKLLYRKFDNYVFGLAQGDADAANPLPVTVIARDTVVLPVQGRAADFVRAASSNADVPLWMRWNDYGIGLLRKRGAGQLRQAEEAFAEVERLEPGMGALNRSRVYVREGRLEEAVDALSRAAAAGAYPWTVTWFSAQVNLQNGFVDEAIADLERLLDTGFAGAEERGFDFGKDYRARNLLAQALIERSRLERGDARRPARESFLQRAIDHYNVVLGQDPENVAAHYGLAQAYADLGREAEAATHRALHAKYKPDDNARDRAVALARRRDPAADRAANSVVIYPLKPGPVSTAYALPGGAGRGR